MKQPNLPTMLALVFVVGLFGGYIGSMTHSVFTVADGNVGLGTDSPQATLDVEGDLRVGKLVSGGSQQLCVKNGVLAVCSSDPGLKNPLGPITGNNLRKLARINFVMYQFYNEPGIHFGVYSNDPEIDPLFVHTDDEGNGYVDYNSLFIQSAAAVVEMREDYCSNPNIPNVGTRPICQP